MMARQHAALLLLSLLVQLSAAHPPLDGEATGGQFWQITDIHWDRNYSASGDVSSWCHGSEQDSGQPGGNGRYGNYSCDSPWMLVKEAVRHMAAVQSRPDFILWTGDNAPHWSDGPDFKYIFSAISSITELMQQSFPDVPIIPCLGNHDSYPQDQFPASEKAFYTRYLTEGGWSRLLSDSEQRTFTSAGYFARRLTDKLTIISLNTNIYYVPNKAISPKEEDPGNQLSWFRDQLKNARTDGYKVIIGAHIAPGYFERDTHSPFLYGNYNDALISLLSQFSDVILAQVYGHAHTDSFRVLGEVREGELVFRSALFMAPSVTPWVPAAGTNPGVRLYSYTPARLTDYTQHVLNLTTSNAAGAAVWQRLYSAAETYQLAELSAESMAALYRRLLSEPALFAEYYRLNTGGRDSGACDMGCKRSQLCAIGHLRQDDMAVCLNSVATMDAIVSGEMLVHGPAGRPQPASGSGSGSGHLAGIVVGVIAVIAVLAALTGLLVVRMRKRPSAPAAVLRNVASFVSVGSQGYETMT